MKKFYILLIISVLGFGIFYFNLSFALENNMQVIVKEEKIDYDHIIQSFDVIVDNKKNNVLLEIKDFNSPLSYGQINVELKLNDKSIIKEENLGWGTSIDYVYDEFKLSKENFKFIKGYDGEIYWAVKIRTRLMVFNLNGDLLKHKPFDQELNYFSYAINFNDNFGNIMDSRCDLLLENGKDAVKEYFYKDSNAINNNGYSSLKVQDDKILSFILAPSLNSHIVSSEDDMYFYLYENEYIIYKNEIYYKNLNKYKVHFAGTCEL